MEAVIEDQLSARLHGDDGKFVAKNRKALCHPDRRHYAKGLCRKCWHLLRLSLKPELGEAIRVRHADYFQRNKRKISARNRKWMRANQGKNRIYHLKSKYGLSADRFTKILQEQGGCCSICRRTLHGRQAPCVDHDHRCCPGRKSCGRCIRGLLCKTCNSHLGWLESGRWILPRAIEYLAAARAALRHSGGM